MTRRETIYGRDREMATLRDFVEGRDPVLVLAGSAGAGKTALWEAGCDLAADAGHRILDVRASDAEVSLAFVGLVDLLDGLEPAAFDGLSTPQRTAIDVALLRAEPSGRAPEAHIVGLALVNVLRALAASGPVLVAIDDVQWLDAPTADAFTFAARRLGDVPVRLLMTERTGAVETPFRLPAEGIRIEVGTLDADALGHLLHERLGLSLPQATLAELERVSHGNPLFALEVGRVLRKNGVPHAGQPLPHPELVEDLVESRVDELPEDVHRVVLAIALSARPRASELNKVVGEDAMHAAQLDGAVAEDRDRLRPAHPLLGAAAVRSASPAQKRAVHAELADVARDDHRRAHHRALAADEPDAQLCAYLASAAGLAGSRGRTAEAVALAEHAVRLCPADSWTRPTRVLELAEHLARVGDGDRLTELLRAELPALDDPSDRASAHLLLCDGRDVETFQDLDDLLEQVLAQVDIAPETRARALARRAAAVASVRVERLAEAETWAQEALDLSRGTWPEVQHDALHSLACVRLLRGLPLEALAAEAASLDDRPSQLHRSVDLLVADRLACRGQIADARARLTRMIEIADETGYEVSAAAVRERLTALDLRAGLCTGGGALAAALRGEPDEADSLAREAAERAGQTGARAEVLEAWRAQGIGALAAGDPARAVGHLSRVWDHMRTEHIEQPGYFPVAADLTEALIAVDRTADADEVTAQLADFGARYDHAWALVSAQRGTALANLARGVDEDAAALSLAAAARRYEELGLRHDMARTLLALGRAQRRRRKWADARAALTESAEVFSALGADGWAGIARGALDRVGARRPQSDPSALTPAERRVAELAAAGHPNKAIAQNLVVSVSTVEAHLTRVYAKLGVRSRAQLAARMND